MKSYRTKALASLAIVGSIAAISLALLKSTTGPAVQSDILNLAQQTDEVTQAFNNYLSRQGKSYLTQSEYQARRDTFKKNYDFIKAHNMEFKEGKVDSKLSLNEYADWSDGERDSILQGDLFRDQQDDPDEYMDED